MLRYLQKIICEDCQNTIKAVGSFPRIISSSNKKCINCGGDNLKILKTEKYSPYPK